jgi:hypothetical protein
MSSQKPSKPTKLVLKKPVVIIISVIVLFIIGYFFGQLLFKILN